MRILKIIHGYPPLYNAGSEVYSQSICDELSKRHEVLVFSREENPFMPDFTIRSEKLHERLSLDLVNMPRAKDGFRHRELDERFAGLIHEFRPDVAHIGHLNHLSTGIVDVLNEAGVPIVFTLHDFWLMCPRGQFLQRNFGEGRLHQLCNGQEHSKCANTCYKMFHSGYEVSVQRLFAYEINHIIPKGKDALNDSRYWTDWIEARMDETYSILDKVDLFLAPSRYLLNRFITDFGMPASKVEYLDYGFPTHYLKPSVKSVPSDKFRFGYIGTHIPAKGVNMLIEAFKGLEDKAELYIWGVKDAQSTSALLLMAAGESAIHFMGAYVNHNLADEVFSRVDCIVVPSIWMENSPLVIHEAQACYVPVITSNAGGMAEYVQHQVNGLLFEHRQIGSLNKQMDWAVAHPLEMKRFGQRGYLHSEDGSIPDIISHCQELERIYNETITKP
jgi:glycosyltransferase involved in cell wall biosynthesis